MSSCAVDYLFGVAFSPNCLAPSMTTPKPDANEQLAKISEAELDAILDSVFTDDAPRSTQMSAFPTDPSLETALAELDRVMDGDNRPYTVRFTGLVFHSEALTSRHTHSFVLVVREKARSVWFVPLTHVREFNNALGPRVRGLEWPELEEVAPALRVDPKSLNPRRGLKVAIDPTTTSPPSFRAGEATYSVWDGRAKGFDWLGD